MCDESSFFNAAVTGEANFAMQSTRLTIGGFTQPGVARSLIEQPTNAEKGLKRASPTDLCGYFPSLFLGNSQALVQLTRNSITTWVKHTSTHSLTYSSTCIAGMAAC